MKEKMSGIYLTVWDDADEFDRILRPTSGGWPHITLAWTGNNLSRDELNNIAKESVDSWFLENVTLMEAKVNSFYYEKENRIRYDVLLMVSKEDVQQVELSRKFIRDKFPLKHEKFGMIEPHVTAKICWSQRDAQNEVDRINKLLPLTVAVIGVSID